MIVGTGKSRNAKDINTIMSEVDPSVIPSVMLNSMYITFTDDTKVSVEKKYLGESIDYKNIDRCLSSLGISTDIKTVEIVLDLDVVIDVFEKQARHLLDPLFER